MTTVTINRLQTAVSDDVAIRFVARLQPAGGRGDKVFPPTYAGGQYAIEERIDEHGEVKKVVLLDSVQSQANRMEQALLAAHRTGRVQLPLVTVDFSGDGELREIGEITVLDAPHRLADAILRDSMLNGTLFPATPQGQVLRRATPHNATQLFRLCPTTLLFGVWESTGAAGGLGVKFQRAIVSEIVGIGAVVGRKTASRIDPLQISSIPIYEALQPEGDIRWTADPTKAKSAEGKEEAFADVRKKLEKVQSEEERQGLLSQLGELAKPYKLDAQGRLKKNAKGRPSEINLGNVTPDVARHRGEVVRLGPDLEGQQRIVRDRDELPGGVTFEYAKHTAVLSLAALRKLHFPLDGVGDGSPQARTVLAALGLFALTELRRNDYDLRSRCALILEGAPALEIVKRDGTTDPFVLDETTAVSLLDEAVRGLPHQLAWQTDPVTLTPSRALVGLIIQSRRLGAVEVDGDEEDEDEVTPEG